MKKTKAFLALMVMCTLIFELCVPVAGAFAMDGANMHADIVHNFDLQSVVRTQTGTAPFDSDDEAGNDSSGDNSIVRSFDKVQYDMTYSGEISTDVQSVEMDVELSLNVPKKYAQFNTELLSSWMTDIVQEDVGGKCVLTGKTTYAYSGGATGGFQSFSETKVVEIDVKGMNQGEELIPTFKVKVSGETEWKEKTMSADSEKAVVSAVPMYDVELKSVGEVNSLGNFDFSTGGSDAPNKGAGDVYGRLLDFAVAIRLKAADNDKGMKGFYVPEEVEEWTFRIDTKIMEDKNETSLQALLWDYKENKRSETGQNGRDLTNGSSGQGLYFAGSLPLTNSSGQSNSYTVNDGGTWTFTQNDDGSIDVTVKGASLYDENGQLIAPTRLGNGSSVISPAPSQGNMYLSTAYFQMVVPIDKNSAENKKFELQISDTDMKVPYKDGQGNEKTATLQTNTKNDNIIRSYETFANGTYGLYHYYAEADQKDGFWGENLSSNKSGMGLDAYTLKDSTVQVVGSFAYSGDDKDNLKAVNMLMKIDDEALQPSASASDGVPTSNNFKVDVRLLYGAKKGGEGWTSDDEMTSAKEEDLEYFDSMASLKKKYPDGVCVAVLAEVRDIKDFTQTTQHMIGFNADIVEGAEEGKVYQNVNTASFYMADKGITKNDTRLGGKSDDKLNDPTMYLRDNNRYDKAQYDDEHQITNGGSAYASYIRGASLLVVGVEAGIEKTIDTATTTFDLSSGITFIPYRLRPVLNVADNKEGSVIKTVKVTDILPEQLKVSDDTKYYYGDKEISPDIEKLSDGTTKLVWTLNNVKTGSDLPAITFKAELDFTKIDLKLPRHDVQNTSYIEADGDNRVFSSKWDSHPNMSKASATLVVNKSMNLSKQALEPLVEINQDIRYRIAFTNTNALDYTNYKMLDVLPYNNDMNGSSFEGTYTTQIKLKAPAGIELYSSESTDVRSKKVSDADINLFKKVDPDSEKDGYRYYSLSEDTTALLLTGTLPSMDQYILDIVLKPAQNSGSDVYANTASMKADNLNDLATPVSKVEVLERSLSGIAWVDQDKDGLIGSAEERIAGLTVKLYQINALTGIEEEARDINGDLCSQVTDSDGKYEFTKLTSGTYRVEFSDKDGEPVLMADYTVTKKGAENQEKVNSKADPILNDEGEMTSAEITGIELPDLEKMRDEKIKKYQKDYQNIGIYKIETSRSVVKVWDDNQDQDGIRPGEVKVQLYKDGKVIEEATLHEKNQWTHVFSGLEKYEKGKEIEYTVKESVVPAGYQDEVSVDDDGNFTIVNSHTVSVPQQPQDPPQGSDTSDTPKTGDDTNLGAMIWVTGASLLLLLILIMKNKDTGKRVQR